jgi:hypothetical protein
MAKILHLDQHERRSSLTQENDLTALLKKVKKEMESTDSLIPPEDNIALLDIPGLRSFIRGKIFDILFKDEYIDSRYFLCGEYIAELIIRTAEKPPSSWYAIDHLEQALGENGDAHWQQAADICFLLCSLFARRTEFRMMKYSDYMNMGKMFYYAFFNQSKKEIGQLMSENYDPMVKITQRSLSL